MIELDTKEKCLENGYRKVYPYNKPSYDKTKFDLIYVGFTIDEITGFIFVEYELREKEESVLPNEFIEIYNEEINN